MLVSAAANFILQYPSYQNDCVVFNGVNGPMNSTYKANVSHKLLNFLTNFFVNVVVNTSMNSNTIVCEKILSGKDSFHIDTS